MLAEHEGGDLALPETVQGLIAARIDGLAPAEKTLLQDASVIGKVFWPGALPGARRAAIAARARAEGVRPARPPLLDRRRDAVRVPPRARAGRRVRADPARRAGGEAPARGGVARVPRRRPHRGPRRDARPSLPRGALALGGGRAGHDGAPRARAPGLRGGGAARVLARRRRDCARARARRARADAARRSGTPAPPARRRLRRADRQYRRCRGAPGAGDRGLHRAGGLRARGRGIRPPRRATCFYRGDIEGGPCGSRPGARARAPGPAVRLDRECPRERLEIRRPHRRQPRRRGSRSLARRWRSPRRPATTTPLRSASTRSGSCTSHTAATPPESRIIEQSVERAAKAGSLFQLHSSLNNLANLLWEVGRLDEGSERILEARALCERYGFASALSWNDAELVYDSSFRGDLERTISLATAFLEQATPSVYQLRPVLATRARALLGQGRSEEAVADAEQAVVGMRGGRARRSGRRRHPADRRAVRASRGTRIGGG